MTVEGKHVSTFIIASEHTSMESFAKRRSCLSV